MHEVWIAHARGATSLILGYKTTQLQLDDKYTMEWGWVMRAVKIIQIKKKKTQMKVMAS